VQMHYKGPPQLLQPSLAMALEGLVIKELMLG
jgi:hypothetical protein